MNIEKLASSVFNEVVSSLSGITSTINIPMEQLKDEIVLTYNSLLYKYSMQNLLPLKDLYYTLTHIPVDCKQMSAKCEDYNDDGSEALLHFELPQIATICGSEAIQYLGSPDKSVQFKIYTDFGYRYHKYSRIKRTKPYVYIDTTPNKNNMYDCYIFNCTFIDEVTAVFIPKDPRDLQEVVCCELADADNISSLTLEVKDTVTGKYINYYRKLLAPPMPNVNTPGGIIAGQAQS